MTREVTRQMWGVCQVAKERETQRAQRAMLEEKARQYDAAFDACMDEERDQVCLVPSLRVILWWSV